MIKEPQINTDKHRFFDRINKIYRMKKMNSNPVNPVNPVKI